MYRIDLNLFDRVKRVFPSDRHELRRAAMNYQYIKREYWDWKSELDLPKTYPSAELELCYIAINAACQHFESSLDFALGLEYLLEEKRTNIIPPICIMLRQTLESALTANWLCSEPEIRNMAHRGFRITMRDLNNQYGFADHVKTHEPMSVNNRFLNIEKIADMKMKMLFIGNKLQFDGNQTNEKFAPIVGRMFRNTTFAGQKQNLTWAYMMLSAIGHGTWLGFYPSEKELTYLINLKDTCLREGLNKLKARTSRLRELAI